MSAPYPVDERVSPSGHVQKAERLLRAQEVRARLQSGDARARFANSLPFVSTDPFHELLNCAGNVMRDVSGIETTAKFATFTPKILVSDNVTVGKSVHRSR